MDRLLNVTAVLSVILLIVVLASVRRAHIRVEYSVSWLLAAVAMLALAPLVSLARYFWHLRFLLQGRGSAARFRAEGNAGPKMAWYIVKAHVALFANLRRLWRQRREIRARARITPAVFRHLMRSHGMSARRVAEL